MDGVHAHLISKGFFSPEVIYTSELVPERNSMGQMSVVTVHSLTPTVDSTFSTWRLTPKQDHLACFFGGSLMLGAVTSGAATQPVSVPPRPRQLTKTGQRDWQTGMDLIETCMLTHDTATGLSPEIAHFRIASDGIVGGAVAQDWYIKGAAYVFCQPTVVLLSAIPSEVGAETD